MLQVVRLLRLLDDDFFRRVYNEGTKEVEIMAVYAVPMNRTPVARKKISTKRKETSHSIAAKKFYDTHNIEIIRDKNGNPSVKVTEK